MMTERSDIHKSSIFNSHWLDRFFNASMDICRNAAEINGFDAGNKAFAWLAELLGLSTTAPQHFHSMGGTAFRTDAFNCQTIGMIVSNRVNTIILIL